MLNFAVVSNHVFFLLFLQVYDVTKFVDVHPGGRDQLIAGAGRDVTMVFRSYHKPDTYKFA